MAARSERGTPSNGKSLPRIGPVNEDQRATREGRGPKVDIRGKRVLVVGLARSGRAAAHAFRQRGAVVVYGRRFAPALTRQRDLRSRGVIVDTVESGLGRESASL